MIDSITPSASYRLLLDRSSHLPPLHAKASLNFNSETGSAAAVTAALGIEPSSSHEIEDLRRIGIIPADDPGAYRRWGNSFWGLESGLPKTASLEQHLHAVIDRVEHRSAQIRDLAQSGYRVWLFCYVYRENGHGGLRLSPAVMGRVAALGVPLDFDVY